MTICTHQTVNRQGGSVTYSHPDGPTLTFDADELMVTAFDGVTAVNVDIGQLGMAELGQALILLGNSLQGDQ